METVTTSKHRRRRWWGIALALLGVILLLVFAPPYVRDARYVDCRSGRTMREIHVVGLRVYQQTQDCEFSRIVAADVDVNMAAQWKPYFSQSPFWQPISPHYRFHSVPHDLDELVAWLRMQHRNEEEYVRARCLEALRFLNDQDVEGLKEYCTSVCSE